MFGALQVRNTLEVAEAILLHRPVLLDETLEQLAVARLGSDTVLVDATLGAGGHAEAMLEAASGATLYGIDRDPAALQAAAERLRHFGPRFVAIHGNHDRIGELLDGAGIDRVDAALFDLGVSSIQLDRPERGFSFRHDGPLDMRMDTSSGPTAAELLAEISVDELTRILRVYGEERFAAPIARAILRRQAAAPITRTRELAELVSEVLGPRARRYRIHPATRTFQSLRIALNREVEQIGDWIGEIVDRLRPGGRLAVISYHSLEDRAVKHAFRALAHRCTCPPRLPLCACGRPDLVRVITARPIRPSDAEVEDNPRSRSARLRIVERLEGEADAR